ncbi:MAG: hypothetical protein FJ224_02380 [Lentisphaerae bacterium]|nr:hypothetical protein [Lentisphaerota bacterium]
MRRLTLSLTVALLSAVVLGGLMEVGLRLFAGRPRGTFAGLFHGRHGLYPESADTLMAWSSVPYLIRANSLGLRGPDYEAPKPAGRVRVAALGDSVSAGSLLDNPDTYPARLQELLPGVEVINAGRHGMSVDGEFTVLRDVVAPLQPDIVVLMFCANDLAELDSLTVEQVRDPVLRPLGLRRALVKWFVTRSALGEAMLDLYMPRISLSYRAGARTGLGPERYEVAGATNHVANALRYRDRFSGVCAGFYGTREDRREEDNLTKYEAGLRAMAAFCRARGARLAFVYHPSYFQLYAPGAPVLIQERLRRLCEEEGMPFLDLTPALRAGTLPGRPLYLAPLDYHPNPDGALAMARAVAAFLAQSFGDVLPGAAGVETKEDVIR